MSASGAYIGWSGSCIIVPIISHKTCNFGNPHLGEQHGFFHLLMTAEVFSDDIPKDCCDAVVDNSPVKPMLRPMALRMARLAAEWWRVGFCQGNFQSETWTAFSRARFQPSTKGRP